VSQPPLDRADARLIERIQQATRGGRALLCSFGRRGKALERDEPERAALLLTALRVHPLYKAGRLAFDMLEIEDLMLDGPPVELLGKDDLTRALASVAERAGEVVVALRRIATEPSDGRAAPEAVEELPRVRFGPEDQTSPADPPPELCSSDYLYDLVVLGVLDVAAELS
jgi:hypothetical protein